MYYQQPPSLGFLPPPDVEIAPLCPSSIQRRLSGSRFAARIRGDAMCPFCLASMGLIVASATSAGGLTALAVKLSQKKKPGHEVTPNSSESSPIGHNRRVGLARIPNETVNAN